MGVVAGSLPGTLILVRSPPRLGSRASSQVAMPSVLSASGRETSLATAPSGTRRARASSSRTSGAAGRLAVVPANSVCWWSCWLAVVRGRCCTLLLYCACPIGKNTRRGARGPTVCFQAGHPTPMPGSPGICPVTARTLQGMAPYPGQARCLALGFWPECFRRLNVKGGRRPFPKETRSALDIEGKHVTIQGPSLGLSPAAALAPSARANWLPHRSVDTRVGVRACSGESRASEDRSSVWLPAWFPMRHVHGSGGRLSKPANLSLLPARTQSLVPEAVRFIPRIFRIMAVRGHRPSAFQAADDGWHVDALVLVTTLGPSTGAVTAPCPAQAPPRTRLLPSLVTDGFGQGCLRVYMSHAV